MPLIPTRTIDFKHANGWGVNNGITVLRVSRPKLLHAAITVGHRGMRGRRAMLDDDDWQAEVARKLATFNGIVTETPVSNGAGAIPRLVPRKSLATLDPTEKGILNYQFGMTMATAWAREVLGVPWLLHLDVYFEALGMPRPTGKRGDMIGRHPDGRWIAVEAKGFKRKPTRTQQSDAKDQAQQITNIGGATPALNIAVLSFFAADPSAAARPKPDVAHLWAVDPPPEEGDPLYSKLDDLSPATFFELYYGQWAFLLTAENELRQRGNFLWQEVPDAGIRIGILPEVYAAIRERDFRTIPDLIKEATSQSDGPASHRAWVGDGIMIELMPG